MGTKIIKKEKKTVVEENYFEEIYCDLCGKKITTYPYDDWTGRSIVCDDLEPEENKPVIGMVTGIYNYGDSYGDHGEVYDICKECYESKIKPLLEKELGLKPRKVDWSV